MTHTKTAARIATSAVVALSALAVLFVLAGCLPSQTAGTAGPSSAKQYLPSAQAQLSTAAPDAKLLLVQTGNIVNATSTPVWSYLFGSPKTNALWVVDVQDGQAGAPSKYGTLKFTAKDWAGVPNADAWKVDSPEAYKKAAEAYGKAAGQGYVMGFVTYVPRATTATVDPFVWSVTFDPEGAGDTKARTVDVNATTGAVQKPK
jgi:hypothetical protein